ncbi:DUF1799 domain-containing protein [Sphingobium aromaticiconvertens]|uniref:DUF1799 domain-containing protein n=1 Tax=Sphingobium aromaticiconvertens TaxID=365341 RepID=UPI0030196124
MTQAAIMPQWMKDRLAGTVERPGQIELSPDEATPFSLFVSLGTQWTRHAMTGMRLGIDYASIRPTADMMDITMTPALLRDIRSMEASALDEFARAARR